MSKRRRAKRVAERAGGSARLPSQVAAARATGGSVRLSARGTAGDWVLLPGGTWRRVETIRVRSLFG
ncbi:hypothetical protein GCM10011579_081860 [Streptomyces albiflavescens]|uniref:Uncharacterized protein n=1 Tax=Streptomyces albiflavescens TaxID=1623582 RepID=A0A918D979_9ACTN|nr:hypothetical protein GCM10011579_081860 [Streptomyces albiflavescens]